MQFFSFSDLSIALSKLNTEKVSIVERLAKAMLSIKTPIPNNMLPMEAACTENELSISIGYDSIMADESIEAYMRIVIHLEFASENLEMAFAKSMDDKKQTSKETKSFLNLTPETMAKPLKQCLIEAARFEESRKGLKRKSMFPAEPHAIKFLVRTKAKGERLAKLAKTLPGKKIHELETGSGTLTKEIGAVINAELKKDGNLIASAEVPSGLWKPSLIVLESGMQDTEQYELSDIALEAWSDA